MANVRATRSAPPDSPEGGNSDLPLDHALALLLADETENALRWGAAVLESGPWTPSALVVTARLLDQMGRRRAAIEGLQLAVHQAIADGNLPLAMAATGDLKSLGAEVEEPLAEMAATFCRGSGRLRDREAEPLLPQLGAFRPLSAFLTGPALATKAAQILETVRRTEERDEPVMPARVAPLPLFSSLRKEPLQALLAAFETLTVPAGHAVIREGEEEAAAYIVARGELEVSRRSAEENGKALVLARLGSGAFFGEMALLSQLPGAASVTATRPSILLVARRDALEEVVERYPEVAVELAAHCRRQAVANLGWASPVIVAIPPAERATFVEHFETRTFDAGDKLIEAGEEARGLHLIVSGEVAIVAYESDERVVLATLSAGETVGEVELVLCRSAAADAIAVRPTATLFLPGEDFSALVQDHPALLHGLYAIAVRRHAETSLALGAETSAAVEEPPEEPRLGENDVPAAPAALVEDSHPYVEAKVEPQRITPLARGTLPLRRVSSPPPRTARVIVPPPVPQSVRTRDTLPGVGVIPSVAPVAASTRLVEKASPTIPRVLVGAGLFAAAAVVALTMRGPGPDKTTAATAAAVATPAAVLPSKTAMTGENAAQIATAASPGAPAHAVPLDTPRPAATKPKTTSPSPVVRPRVEARAVAAASAAPAASADTVPVTAPASAAVPTPSRAILPRTEPPAGDAVPTGEFGGRE